MLVNQRLSAVGVLLVLVTVIALVACGDAATPEPRVIEVTKVVTETVTETVVETKEVPVEVTKIVTETVIETRDVPVEVPVEVTKVVTETVVETVPVTQIVERTVVVEATPAPPAAKDTIIFGDLNWPSALLQNRIAQYIVEHGYGYPTDVKFRSHPALV